jgi:hypothetical protein
MAQATYDGLSELTDRVDVARRAWSRAYVMQSVFKFVVIFCGALLLFSLAAGLGPVPSLVRWAMLLVLIALLFGGAVLFIFKPLFREWTDEEVAVHVEAKFPEIENAVINSIQLAKDPLIRQHGVIAHIISRAEHDTRDVPFSDAIDRRPAMRIGLAAGIVLIGLAAYALLFGDTFSRALQRILMPTAYIPMAGNAELLDVKPGSATVIAGDPVRVVATYRKLGMGEIGGTLVYTPPEGKPVRREMKPLGNDQFIFTLPEVRTPLRYRVNIGGTESKLYDLAVTERPAVTRVDIVYTFPTYTGEGPRRDDDTNGDVKALVGAQARLLVTASKAARSGAIQGYGDDVTLAVDKDNPRRLTGAIQVRKSGSYTIAIKDREGNPNRSPVIRRVIALPDRKPVVRVTSPGKDVTAQPGGSVDIAFKATDDYGIVVAELIARRERSTTSGRAAARWTAFANRRNVIERYTFPLPSDVYKPGDVIEYWVTVTDNRWAKGVGAGQTARTPSFLVKIQDRKHLVEEKVKNLKRWQERLRKVLEQEIGIRNRATEMEALNDAARFAALAAPLGKDQAAARIEVQRIAGDIQPDDATLRRIKEVLYALAANEMASAVRRAEAAAKAPALSTGKTELAEFEKDVDKVIAVIRKILDIMPRLEEQAKKEEDEDEGLDLSDEAKEQLKDLQRGLKDFIEEQKKVIDGTQELAQKNVDDFTKEDDKKLKDLAATEDKWSQFMKEKHHDLSKLPEQDLANSTMLKELIEVQSEVEMAKDALAKKAKEIATALEDNGLEMAKSLTTHIEKWLPDTPDRDQWKMEEMLGEAEAPMAELPKELEDLVGDLMEDEEDLMEDVEDATAGYADSLDKGAGWDAMDGPISNMSAQGVTGNRLPNKSEIGGRSGEGRSGKSAGEFVEENATGKGGRKTPTRLTPDPYEKGQVNDTSKDPVGGSTGGGKASGAGAGGLEGPVPPQVEAKLKALAARQAEIRNKAEKIDAKFKVMNWPSPFEETVKEMKLAEDDLRDGRYKNVLRRRPIILKNLKGTRMFLKDQIQVNKDYSSALPNYLQDEILDATEGGTPRGYEKLLKDYYKSISQQGK